MKFFMLHEGMEMYSMMRVICNSHVLKESLSYFCLLSLINNIITHLLCVLILTLHVLLFIIFTEEANLHKYSGDLIYFFEISYFIASHSYFDQISVVEKKVVGGGGGGSGRCPPLDPPVYSYNKI